MLLLTSMTCGGGEESAQLRGGLDAVAAQRGRARRRGPGEHGDRALRARAVGRRCLQPRQGRERVDLRLGGISGRAKGESGVELQLGGGGGGGMWSAVRSVGLLQFGPSPPALIPARW
jgi:hypothetical protein